MGLNKSTGDGWNAEIQEGMFEHGRVVFGVTMLRLVQFHSLSGDFRGRIMECRDPGLRDERTKENDSGWHGASLLDLATEPEGKTEVMVLPRFTH